MDGYTLEDQIAYAWSSARRTRAVHSLEHIHLARYVRPELAEFFEERKTTDRPAIELIWDDTPIKANDMWARGVWSMAHNPTSQWFFYKHKATANVDDESTAWIGRVNSDLQQEAKSSGLYPALLERLKDTGAFGFGALYSYENKEDRRKITFEYVPAPECFYTLNREGRCNFFIRPLNITAKEAIEERKWPKEKLDRSIVEAYERKDITTKFLFLHVVWERAGPLPARPLTNKQYPIAGYFYQVSNRSVVDEHGFKRFPYHVLGWGGAVNTPYPAGIGYKTLAEIRNLNATRRDYSEIIGLEADSPVLAPQQGEQPGSAQFKPVAGEMIWGGMSGEGKRLYEPYYNGTNSRQLLPDIQDSRNEIREAWNYSLFMMHTQKEMTAQEVRSRDAKIVQAMGPYMIYFQSDAQSVIERMFLARLEAGVYDPIPRQIAESPSLELEFSGLLAKAQQQIEGEQIVGFYSEASLIAGFDADVVRFGIDHAAALRHLAESKTMPTGIVLSKEAYEEAVARNAQQQQMMQAAAMAPDLARAARDGAAAMKDMNANESPSNQVAAG